MENTELREALAKPSRLGATWGSVQSWARDRQERLNAGTLAAQAGHQMAMAFEVALRPGGGANAAALLNATQKSYGLGTMEQAMRARCWRVRRDAGEDDFFGSYWMVTPAMIAALAGSPEWCRVLAAMVSPDSWADRVASASRLPAVKMPERLEPARLSVESWGPLLVLAASGDAQWDCGFSSCRDFLPFPGEAERHACRLMLEPRPNRLAQFESWVESWTIAEAAAPALASQPPRGSL